MTNDDFFDFKLVTWVEAKMPERKKPNLNANTNPSANPDASVNTAESAQIQTEAQEAAENANVQTTEVDKNTQGTEKVSAVEQSAENKNASAKTEVARDIQRADDQKSLKDQIKDHKEELNKMDVVSAVDVDSMADMSKTEKTAYVMGMIGKRLKNGGIERADIGFIELGEKQIKKSYKYLYTASEYMALATVPDVLKNGVIITERSNHKDRGHSTVTIAAPVTINGKRGNIAVLLKKTNGMKYKVHRILSPDNSEFSLENAEAEPTPVGVPTQKKSEEGPTISSASNDSIAQKEKPVNTSKEKTSVKRALTIDEQVNILMQRGKTREEAEKQIAKESQKVERIQTQRGMSQSKFEAKPKKEKADAEAKAKAEAEAKEAEKAAHWDAYTKARDEATLALGVDQFALMSAEARDRVTRMYMELSGIKGVTAETKKALASILAVRPGLYIFTTDKLADNGAWWYNKATGGRAIVINKNSGAITNTILHEITHDLAKENSKHYENLSKAVLANTSDEDKQKVYDAYLMRHLRDYNQIDESATLEEAKQVFKTFSEENQKHFDDMVKEEITTRAVAEKLGNKNFLHEHGKEHRFAILKAIAHLRKLGSSLVHRSEADKYVREIEKNFKGAVFKDNAQAERFMKKLREWEEEEEIKRALADITPEDVELLRAIGKKRINDFTEEDLQAVEKWARKFYAELGTKSPFFRAWFGDWREHDHKTKTSIIPIETLSLTNKAEVEAYIKKGLKEKSLFRGNVRNKDTDFDINIGAQVYNDTLTYANREYSRDKDFDSYLARITLLSNIKELTEKSIFFDTETVTPKDNVPKQTFMHVFYSVVNIGEKNYLAKVKVDELDNEGVAVRRAYNVNNIEISPVAVTRDYSPAGTTDDTGGDSLSINSISDLFAFVKTYDKDFSPNPSSAIRNADGTPKIMYHGSPAQFSSFDKKKAKSSGLYSRGFYFRNH